MHKNNEIKPMWGNNIIAVFGIYTTQPSSCTAQTETKKEQEAWTIGSKKVEVSCEWTELFTIV